MALPIFEVIEHYINVLNELLKIRDTILITRKVPMKEYVVGAVRLVLTDFEARNNRG